MLCCVYSEVSKDYEFQNDCTEKPWVTLSETKLMGFSVSCDPMVALVTWHLPQLLVVWRCYGNDVSWCCVSNLVKCHHETVMLGRLPMAQVFLGTSLWSSEEVYG